MWSINRTEDILLAMLSGAFWRCPGTPRWHWPYSTPATITSSLYNAIIQLPLHTNYSEVVSAFIKQLTQQVVSPDYQYEHLTFHLAYIVEIICRVRRLSAEELSAIRSCVEIWLETYVTLFLPSRY
jgi:hypothetical protein